MYICYWCLQRGGGQVRFSKPASGNETMSVEVASVATDVTDPVFLVSVCFVVTLL